MINLTLTDIASAIGGRIEGNPVVSITGSVETDSRLVGAGSLFFAKPGEFDDGHDYVLNAQRAGAVAVVVERVVSGVDIPQLVVANSVSALGLLAKHVLKTVRNRGGLKVVAITGSNGKTTTKNMLGQILGAVGQIVSPIESYNNEVGAPISILKVDFDTDFLIAEVGAGGPGSVRYLAQIIEPDIAVILKVGMAHAGEFGGIENTAKIKSELVEVLGSEDRLLLNADDGYVRAMADGTAAEITWFGSAGDSNYRASNYSLSIEGTGFDLHWPDGQTNHLTLKILGEHHVMNALASAAAADLLGVNRQTIISRLEQMELAERWRMQLLQREDGASIINDAYNASPDSMKAALQTLAQLGRSGRRTVAVLGEMAELGEFSAAEHDTIGRIVVRLNIKQLIVIGAAAKLIHMGASQEGSWDGESKFFESIAEAEDYLRGMLEPADIVLVKSSKSANLRQLGDKLMEASF